MGRNYVAYLTYLGASAMFWQISYWLLCYRVPATRCRSGEWNCRILTLVFAVSAVTSSFICGMFYSPWVFTDSGGPTTVMEETIIIIAFGYFVFDFIWCLQNVKSQGYIMIFHHSLSLLMLGSVIAVGLSGTEVNAVIFGTEITNPFLQMRWFMKESKLQYPNFSQINEIVFVLTFFIFRILIGSYFLYTELSNPRPLLWFKLGGFLIYTVSWVFMIQIFSYSYYQLRKRSKMKHRNVLNGSNSYVQNGANYSNVSNNAGCEHVKKTE